MMILGHLTVATAAFLVYVDVVTSGQWGLTLDVAIGWLLTMVGSLLPDLDHPDSTLGKRFKFISYPISALFGHRGITHSLIAVAGVSYAAYTFQSVVISWLAMGYLLHLFGGLFNTFRCAFALPFSKKLSRFNNC
ncbi:metal-dependent hydrolase [Colwellia sp. MSW7]|uniref:Metal-dependent hydrolase n=1 Tax=Colwellia maritima TaxID=2912588 RepID=A0ABS9X6S2_9GAMM|nr:metal-dependent hydrolase [Colwellia maritima]MCI2285922.1 metal-dependent hydrolase [Colwellia maritima]